MARRWLAGAMLSTILLGTWTGTAMAGNLRSDYKSNNTAYFIMWGDQFTRVETGGYDNPASNAPCWPSHVWSYVHLYTNDELAEWRHPDLKNMYYGEWQAYITTSGTRRRAVYSSYSGSMILNQYAYHGWTSIILNGYVQDGFYLGDGHDGYSWGSTQKVDWDAIHVYY